MPIYLLHGFRWPRKAIRDHIIFNNVNEAAPEYIVSPGSATALLENFRGLYKEVMEALPKLRLIEAYEPMDVSSAALPQPYAFVADKVEICHLSLDVSEAMNQGIPNEGWDALMDLKERLAPGEKLGWWVVYNGDELRRLVGDRQIEQVGPRSSLAIQETNQ